MKLFLFFLSFFFLFNSIAQNHSDSLSGFDESEATKQAISEGFSGQELKSKIFRMKRDFVSRKYKINAESAYPQGRTLSPTSFINEDFELSSPGPVTSSTQVNGWVCEQGNNLTGDNCNLLGCCAPPLNGEIEVINCAANNGYVDPTIGSVYPLYSVFGASVNSGSCAGIPFTRGNIVLRINDYNNNYTISRASKKYLVTNSNSLMQLASVSVFAVGHNCCDGSSFSAKIFNVNTGSFVSCPIFTMGGMINTCTTTPVSFFVCGAGAPYTGNNASYIFNKWKLTSFDLTPYIGDTVIVELAAADCMYGGHFGYTYLDAKFSPFAMFNNDSMFVANGDTINYVACPGGTVYAPPGYESYTWTGPNMFFAQAIVNPVPGTYTLSMLQPGACGGIIKLVNISYATPAVSITSTGTNICVGSSATLSVNGLNTCTWSAGANTSSVIVTPPQGSTIYSVSGTWGYGCAYQGTIAVQANLCTGIEAIQENSIISIFPNPAKGEFNVKISQLNFSGEIRITNSQGQRIYTGKMSSGLNMIRLKELPDAIYDYAIFQQEKIISRGKIRIEQ